MVSLLQMSQCIPFLYWQIILKIGIKILLTDLLCENTTDLFSTNSSSINAASHINIILFINLSKQVWKDISTAKNEFDTVSAQNPDDMEPPKIALTKSKITTFLAPKISKIIM